MATLNIPRKALFFKILKPLEVQLLEALYEKLDDDARLIFKRQVQRIRQVVRSPSLKTHHINYGRNAESLPEPLLFPFRACAKLAQWHFFIGAKHCRVDIEIVTGSIFELKFSLRPSYRILRSAAENLQTKILMDPLESVILNESTYETLLKGVSVLPRISREYSIRGRRPYEASEIDMILGDLKGNLPADYLNLLAQTDGVEIGERVELRGAADIDTVDIQGENMIVIGDIDGIGAILQRGQPGQLAIYIFEEDKLVDIEGSFEEGLLDILAKSATGRF